MDKSVRAIFLSSTSACFELTGGAPYYAGEKYSVYLNGERVIAEEAQNVFSLFSLTPNTRYELTVGDHSLSFTTADESGVVTPCEFGAVGDGIADDTVPIREAIAACPIGGRVYIPEGVYLTEPVRLKSDMTLELARGAVLLGFSDTKRYDVLPAYIEKDGERRIYSVYGGEAQPCYASLISAYFEKNINIVGEGIIDGNAHTSEWWTTAFVKNAEVKRPRLVFLNGCECVNFHGILGRNSPSWNFHPFLCDGVGYYGVRVEADKNSPNTDGINPECCDGVEIIGCHFSVGDDCIAVKSGKIDIGKSLAKPSRCITVRNCLMEFGHGGVVLGSEISGGVRELSVTGCVFRGTERGLRIKTRRGRGESCVVDGVEFENIVMERVGTPFVINMHYNCDPDGNSDYVQSRLPLPVDGGTPRFGGFSFKNITALDCQAAAAYFEGLAEMPIRSVRFENVKITLAADAQPALIDGFLPRTYLCRAGMIFKNVDSVTLENTVVEGYLGDKIVTESVCSVIES